MPSRPPPSPHLLSAEAGLPLFDGFPFLATRLVPAACHVTLLPTGWSRDRLLGLLAQQVAANQFDAALVLSPDEAHYRWPGDRPVVVGPPPRSTAMLTGGLLTPEPLDQSAVAVRHHRLQQRPRGPWDLQQIGNRPRPAAGNRQHQSRRRVVNPSN